MPRAGLTIPGVPAAITLATATGAVNRRALGVSTIYQ